MHLSRSIVVGAEPKSVFEVVADPTRYPEFFEGITRWKRLSEEVALGGRFRVLMRVGSIDAGGTVRVTGWVENETIAWESETGVQQRGCWKLEEHPDGTLLSLTIDYGLSGGPAGWLVERLTARIVGRNMWATLLAARRLIELD